MRKLAICMTVLGCLVVGMAAVPDDQPGISFGCGCGEKGKDKGGK